MPIHSCGEDCQQWGQSGKKYRGPNARLKAAKQAAAIRASGRVSNAKRRLAKRKSPLRGDPTRLATLRRQFRADLARRFSAIEKAIRTLVIKDDAFGLLNKAVFNYDVAQSLLQAARETNTNPTEEQKASGNYRKGKFWFQGLEIAIENPQGSIRRGKSSDGKPWSIQMQNHYGYIKRTESEADGDHVDCFIGPDLFSNRVFVIDQNKAPDFKTFDEHKVMLGFSSAEEAKASYLSNYSDDWQGFSSITELTMEEFKQWVFEGDTSKPLGLTTNAERFQFQSAPQQITSFKNWLMRLLRSYLIDEQVNEDYQWFQRYVEDGFAKGAGRAFDDTRPQVKEWLKSEGATEPMDFYNGTRAEFLRSAFGRPVSVEKVKLLAGRTLTDLKGVSDTMATKMSRTLTDGLVQGQHPRVIASNLVKEVSISRSRANTIAQTEITRCHAEGQLQAFDLLGVTRLGVMAEWATADDDRVCPLCESLDDVVMTVEEAKGLLPRHPNCRCAWIPANVGEDEAGQIRSQSDIEDAIEESLDEEGGEDKSTWIGADKSISQTRPQGIFNTEKSLNMPIQNPALLDKLKTIATNSFCATGKGGGVDPSCGKDNAIVNLPLSKRGGGSLDSQIDKHKKEEERKQKLEGLKKAKEGREDKTTAKAMFDKYADRIAESMQKNKGVSKKDVLKHLDSLVKWEAKKAIALFSGYETEWAKKGESSFSEVENTFCATGKGGGIDPTCGNRMIKDLQGHKIPAPRMFFRGTEPERTERIKTGAEDWDSYLFVSSNESGAKAYGSSIEKVMAKPEAKILYEGTKEYRSLGKGIPATANLLEASKEIAKRAKSAGYDAVWFKRQTDVGTAILNPGMFDREKPSVNNALSLQEKLYMITNTKGE